jgi:hypothetical protein
MSRSASRLRNTLFGVFLASSMAFGAAQAFAAPPVGVPIPLVCHTYDPSSGALCNEECVERGYASGYCGQEGACRCLR